MRERRWIPRSATFTTIPPIADDSDDKDVIIIEPTLSEINEVEPSELQAFEDVNVSTGGEEMPVDTASNGSNDGEEGGLEDEGDDLEVGDHDHTIGGESSIDPVPEELEDSDIGEYQVELTQDERDR